MGLINNIVGAVKDSASISKATLQPDGSKTLALRLTILKVTNHDATNLPPPRHLAALLSFGHGASRADASSVIGELMLRLHSTRSSAVAIKCLLALHVIVKQGSFILHDQLSVYHSTGGRNNLNFSSFRRDSSSAAAWELSAWVRWFAKYLEQILSASRAFGFFIFSESCRMERDKAAENLPSLLNRDLVREVDALVCVMEEIVGCPEELILKNENQLVKEVIRLLKDDYLIAVSDLSNRIGELFQRTSYLKFSESADLAFALKRLEECEGRLSLMFPPSKSNSATLCHVARLRKEVMAASSRWCKEEDSAAVARWGKKVVRIGGSESARFEGNRTLLLNVGWAESECGNFGPSSSNRFTFQHYVSFPGNS